MADPANVDEDQVMTDAPDININAQANPQEQQVLDLFETAQRAAHIKTLKTTDRHHIRGVPVLPLIGNNSTKIQWHPRDTLLFAAHLARHQLHRGNCDTIEMDQLIDAMGMTELAKDKYYASVLRRKLGAALKYRLGAMMKQGDVVLTTGPAGATWLPSAVQRGEREWTALTAVGDGTAATESDRDSGRDSGVELPLAAVPEHRDGGFGGNGHPFAQERFREQQRNENVPLRPEDSASRIGLGHGEQVGVFPNQQHQQQGLGFFRPPTPPPPPVQQYMPAPHPPSASAFAAPAFIPAPAYPPIPDYPPPLANFPPAFPPATPPAPPVQQFMPAPQPPLQPPMPRQRPPSAPVPAPAPAPGPAPAPAPIRAPAFPPALPTRQQPMQQPPPASSSALPPSPAPALAPEYPPAPVPAPAPAFPPALPTQQFMPGQQPPSALASIPAPAPAPIRAPAFPPAHPTQQFMPIQQPPPARSPSPAPAPFFRPAFPPRQSSSTGRSTPWWLRSPSPTSSAAHQHQQLPATQPPSPPAPVAPVVPPGTQGPPTHEAATNFNAFQAPIVQMASLPAPPVLDEAATSNIRGAYLTASTPAPPPLVATPTPVAPHIQYVHGYVPAQSSPIVPGHQATADQPGLSLTMTKPIAPRYQQYFQQQIPSPVSSRSSWQVASEVPSQISSQSSGPENNPPSTNLVQQYAPPIATPKPLPTPLSRPVGLPPWCVSRIHDTGHPDQREAWQPKTLPAPTPPSKKLMSLTEEYRALNAVKARLAPPPASKPAAPPPQSLPVSAETIDKWRSQVQAQQDPVAVQTEIWRLEYERIVTLAYLIRPRCVFDDGKHDLQQLREILLKKLERLGQVTTFGTFVLMVCDRDGRQGYTLE